MSAKSQAYLIESFVLVSDCGTRGGNDRPGGCLDFFLHGGDWHSSVARSRVGVCEVNGYVDVRLENDRKSEGDPRNGFSLQRVQRSEYPLTPISLRLLFKLAPDQLGTMLRNNSHLNL